MRVRYINSQNYSVDFVDANILPTSGYLHQRKWNTTIENDSVSLSIGNYTYTITLTLRGSLKERKETLDKMCDIFELDCINETPGTLYFGDYHIKCYIVSSNTSIANINTRTNVELGIFCIKQEWIKEKKYNLVMYDDKSNQTGIKKYTYRYPFLYSNQKGAVQAVNDSLVDADFIMRFYGPCANPYIKVGNILYQVNTSLMAGEYLEINSTDNTIFCFSVYGEKRNLFNYRDMSRSDFFTKIPSGSNVVGWDGTFKAELIILDKRTEPRWL